VPQNQRKSVLQCCMQVRNRSRNGEDLGVGFPCSWCADFADLVCFEGVDLTEHSEAEYCALNNRLVPKFQRKSGLQHCMQVCAKRLVFFSTI
jgi:hypothetical protein